MTKATTTTATITTTTTTTTTTCLRNGDLTRSNKAEVRRCVVVGDDDALPVQARVGVRALDQQDVVHRIGIGSCAKQKQHASKAFTEARG